LEQLLDHCTPLYKARFEALAPQAQQVVHAVATHWDPISAGELADLMELEVNKVSAQLNRLVQQGVIEKVPYDPPTKTGFQIAERFFNIWYLMRASRRVRRRLIWLVEFLRMFYSQDELGEKALKILKSDDLPAEQRLVHAEFAFALARALESRDLRKALEDAGLHAILSTRELRSHLQELVDLDGQDSELRDRAEYRERYRRLREQLYAKAKKARLRPDDVEWVVRVPALSIEEKERWLSSIKPTELVNLSKGFAEAFGEFFELDPGLGAIGQSLLAAFRRGYMESFDDYLGAKHAGMALNAPGLERQAFLLSLVFICSRGRLGIGYAVMSLLLAIANLRVERWEAAEGFFRAAVMESESPEGEELDRDTFSGLLSLLITEFFQEAVARGYSAESVSLLERLKLNSRWRPLHEALVACTASDRARLNRLASELRMGVVEILGRFGAEGALGEFEDQEYPTPR
jgi:hypothetical protein